MSESADAVIARLSLEPHPEGGHYRRVLTSDEVRDGRPVETAILYLLAAGERSHWHRIDAVETWQHEVGGALELRLSGDGQAVAAHVLGADDDGVVVVPAHTWQSAAPLDDWALVRCTVRPGFRFEGFELAPPGWEPSPSPGEHS